MKFTIEIELEQGTVYWTKKPIDIRQELVNHLREFLIQNDDGERPETDYGLEFGHIAIPSEECWDCYNMFEIIAIN